MYPDTKYNLSAIKEKAPLRYNRDNIKVLSVER